MPAIPCGFPGYEYITGNYSGPAAAAALNSHLICHTKQTETTPSKVEKVPRPQITTGRSTEEWLYFLSRWEEYKRATQIKNLELITQLLACCDEPLRADLFRAHGSQSTESEQNVISAIQKLAVCQENTMVARVTLSNMKQDPDEPVRRYAAKLMGQAGTCKYIDKTNCPNCNTEVLYNYTEAMVRDALTKGIANCDIRQDLLGKTDQDMTLEQVVRFIEAKETAKQSESHLSGETTAAVRSSYRRANTPPPKSPNQTPSSNSQRTKFNNIHCGYCGLTGHGNRKEAYARKGKCPAFGNKCEKCNIFNHSASVCKRKAPRQKANTSAATYDSEETYFPEDYENNLQHICTLSINK